MAANLNDILQIREAIDRMDDQLLQLLNDRACLVQRAGQVKKTDYYRPERELQILDRLKAANPGPLAPEDIRRIYREIVSSCMALEYPLRLAYLGPPGTFSEIALRRQFGSNPEARPCHTINDVFRAIESEACDFGVVPIENSGEGSVGVTMDQLLVSTLFICGEIILAVHYNLLSHAGTAREIKKVYGHAQALAQCQGSLLRYLPSAEQCPVASNGEGARLAAEQKDAGALASDAAAHHYQLPILQTHLEDQRDNCTRFLVMGRQKVGVGGKDKTSVVCSAANRPGSVYRLIEPLARHNISMTRLESRPSRQTQWDYVFYIDIEGHQLDEKVAVALQEMSAQASFFKILGSYPRAFA